MPANDVLSADQCQSMAEVRRGVDALDKELVALLNQRFAYMRAAARIKQSRDAVRDEVRKQAVIAAAKAEASAFGLPSGAIGEMWGTLVEASIAYEMDEWDRIRA